MSQIRFLVCFRIFSASVATESASGHRITSLNLSSYPHIIKAKRLMRLDSLHGTGSLMTRSLGGTPIAIILGLVAGLVLAPYLFTNIGASVIVDFH
ncbi:MAG: hypothetical protein ACXV4B_09480 [Halobacteriota archaeon]